MKLYSIWAEGAPPSPSLSHPFGNEHKLKNNQAERGSAVLNSNLRDRGYEACGTTACIWEAVEGGD